MKSITCVCTWKICYFCLTSVYSLLCIQLCTCCYELCSVLYTHSNIASSTFTDAQSVSGQSELGAAVVRKLKKSFVSIQKEKVNNLLHVQVRILVYVYLASTKTCGNYIKHAFSSSNNVLERVSLAIGQNSLILKKPKV